MPLLLLADPPIRRTMVSRVENVRATSSQHVVTALIESLYVCCVPHATAPSHGEVVFLTAVAFLINAMEGISASFARLACDLPASLIYTVLIDCVISNLDQTGLSLS